jgi:Flp pilus assembly protein TadG
MEKQTGRMTPAENFLLRPFNRIWQGLARSGAAMARSTNGTSVVEFAVSAPILLGLLVPVADLGMAFAQRQQVQQAVQAGAQYAASHRWHRDAPDEIATAVRAATTISGLSVTPAPYQVCGCPSGTAVATMTCGTTCSNGQTAGYYVVIGAEVSYTPVLPYSALSSQTTLTGQSTVRIR